MTAASLQDIVLLNTRPAHQQQELNRAVTAAGGRAVSLPLLRIEAIEDSAQVNRLKRQVENLDRYEILIFVSTNAASLGAHWIESYWPQLPQDLRLIAIGPTTAERLGELLQAPVTSSPQGMTSEDILCLPALQAVAGQRIGIVRGVGGRELLAETLRQRGAQVDYLEVYTRQAVPYASGEIPGLIASEGINVILVTSGESLQRLEAAMVDNKEMVSLIPLLVPSKRVAEQAVAMGYTRAMDIGGADTAAVIAALGAIAESL